jgi:hypothetical protein
MPHVRQQQSITFFCMFRTKPIVDWYYCKVFEANCTTPEAKKSAKGMDHRV